MGRERERSLDVVGHLIQAAPHPLPASLTACSPDGPFDLGVARAPAQREERADEITIAMMFRLVALVMMWVDSAASLHVASALRTSRAAMPQVAMSATFQDRRSMLSAAGAAAVFSALPTAALAADKPKVVIFGGSGYVGAYASQILLAKGADVIVASRKTPAEAQDKVKSILGKSLDGVKYVSLDATSADLSGVLSGATGVISCVGIAPGGSNQREGNGKANVRIAEAVKAAGIANFAYLGVASELSNGPIKFIFGDYVKGKAEAEAAVVKNLGGSALILEPGIIAGAPPGEVRPPGPPGMSAVSVDEVARAAVAGALGLKSGKVDGNAAITAAAASLGA